MLDDDDDDVVVKGLLFGLHLTTDGQHIKTIAISERVCTVLTSFGLIVLREPFDLLFDVVLLRLFLFCNGSRLRGRIVVVVALIATTTPIGARPLIVSLAGGSLCGVLSVVVVPVVVEATFETSSTRQHVFRC